ncbi:MAG: hypothetical protein F6K30_26110, partial [Cyanothece sp. SIO2G6]|nr:hypothetical protein [Cyanothece sp. SIO2G6]
DEQTNQVATLKFLDEDRSVDIAYSEGGRREEVNDARGKTVYDYDSQGRPLSRIDPDGQSIQYTYGDSGKLETITTASGTITYGYDDLNRLATITKGDQLTNYDYDKAGNLTQIVYPNRIVEDRVYDDLNRLTSVTNTHEDGTVLSKYVYTLDNVGNRTKVEELSGRTVEYDYDTSDRLVKETITDPATGSHVVEYVYDTVGNRLSKIDSIEGTTTYTYDANDRLTLEVGPSTTIQYTYDDNGNLIKEESLDGRVVEYIWNDQNQLIQIDQLDGDNTTTIQYQYDMDGIRVATIVNGEETRYLIDNNRPHAEVIEEYSPGQDANVAYVHGREVISQTRGNELDFYLYDGHSGVRQLSDETGTVTDTYTFDAYGNLLDANGTTENDYLYRGEQDDAHADLQYLRARYYDTDTGRFISTDPFEGWQEVPISRHRYVYGNNNPLTYIDPSGETATTVGGALGGATLGGILQGINWAAAINIGSGILAGGLTLGGIASRFRQRIQSPKNRWRGEFLTVYNDTFLAPNLSMKLAKLETDFSRQTGLFTIIPLNDYIPVPLEVEFGGLPDHVGIRIATKPVEVWAKSRGYTPRPSDLGGLYMQVKSQHDLRTPWTEGWRSSNRTPWFIMGWGIGKETGSSTTIGVDRYVNYGLKIGLSIPINGFASRLSNLLPDG